MNKLVLVKLDNYPDYSAGSDGCIYSHKNNKTIKMKASLSSSGYYLFVALRHNKRYYQRSVHKLVCEAFNGPCPEGYETSHINGDSKDNRPSNLKWETRTENLNRRKDHGTDDVGVRNSRAAFNLEEVKEIRLLIKKGLRDKEIAGIMKTKHYLIQNIRYEKRYKGQGYE